MKITDRDWEPTLQRVIAPAWYILHKPVEWVIDWRVDASHKRGDSEQDRQAIGRIELIVVWAVVSLVAGWIRVGVTLADGEYLRAGLSGVLGLVGAVVLTAAFIGLISERFDDSDLAGWSGWYPMLNRIRMWVAVVTMISYVTSTWDVYRLISGTGGPDIAVVLFEHAVWFVAVLVAVDSGHRKQKAGVYDHLGLNI